MKDAPTSENTQAFTMTSFIKHQMWLSSICSKTEAGERTTKPGGELLFHFLLNVELSTSIWFLFNETPSLLLIINHVLQYWGVPSLKPTTRSHPDLPSALMVLVITLSLQDWNKLFHLTLYLFTFLYLWGAVRRSLLMFIKRKHVIVDLLQSNYFML